MDEDMNVGELLKETAEENQTRKILEILNECKDLAEAKERETALNCKKYYTPFGKRKEEGVNAKNKKRVRPDEISERI